MTYDDWKSTDTTPAEPLEPTTIDRIEAELEHADADLAARDARIDELEAELAGLRTSRHMTYADLFDAVAERLAGTSYSVQVHTWRFVHDGVPDERPSTPEWIITWFDGAGKSRIVKGRSASEALDAFNRELAGPKVDTLAETSARLEVMP